jgi:hypothetical protein
MAIKITREYPITIECWRTVKEMPELASSIQTYTQLPTSSIGPTQTSFKPVVFNSAAINKSLYRNGILESESLMTKISNESIKVYPGEYTLKGEPHYLSYDTYINYFTNHENDSLIELDHFNSPLLNIWESNIWTKEDNERIVAVPKLRNDSYNITPSPSYKFNSNNIDIQVDNYWKSSSDTFAKFTSDKSNIVNSLSDSQKLTFCEYLGETTYASPVVFRTKFFPISEIGTEDFNITEKTTKVFMKLENTNEINTFHIYNSLQELEEADDYYGCFVDRSTGKVFMSRKKIFKEEEYAFVVDSSSNSSRLILNAKNASIESWADAQYLQIVNPSPSLPTNEICYVKKLSPTQLLVTEFVETYSANSEVSCTQASSFPIPIAGKVYISYSVVMNMESHYPKAMPRPLSQQLKPWLWKNQRSIAVLGKEKTSAFKISLKALGIGFLRNEKNVTVYGPVSSESEVILLEGLIEDSEKNPVPFQDATVFLKESDGTLNGERGSTNVTSNDEGKFYVTYDPNFNRVSWIIFKDSEITYDDKSNTFLTYNNSYNQLREYEQLSADQKDAIVFAIRKDDGSVGTVGKKIDIDVDLWNSFSVVNNGYGAMSFEIAGSLADQYSNIGSHGTVIFDSLLKHEIDEYTNGTIDIVGTDEEHIRTIKRIVPFAAAWEGDEPNLSTKMNTYLIIYDSEIADSTGNISSIRLYKAGDIRFNSEIMNGRKVVLAEEKSSNWEHPNSDENLTVYGPVVVSDFDSSNLVFEVAAVLPESSSSDREKDIAGFALIPNRSSLIQAFTVTEEKTIYSNVVGFSLVLSDRDKGVVKTILDNLYIPYGFRIRNNKSEVSSTIGTATFLTVNTLNGNQPLDPKFPLISYLNANGIIYLGDSGETENFQSSSSTVNFTIKVTD